MIIKKGLLFLLPAIFFRMVAFGQTVSPESRIFPLLQQLGEKFPQEKVHLHLDRNYHSSGDTLRFRAYVVNAQNNQLTDLSKVLYIDLLNNQDSRVIELRFPIDDGGVSGWVALPDSLEKGTYTLRAYTAWMRNFKPELFYRTTLKIDNPANSKQNISRETQKTNSKELHNIQFFPEGGDLVNGITSVIAFKAIGNTGLGEDVSGTITDESGKILSNLQSSFAGMGRFNLTPTQGHSYEAHVRFKDGVTKKITLPPALPSGYALAVNNQDKANVIVQVMAGGLNTTEPVWLAAQANNKLISLTKLNLTGNQGSISIPKRTLPTGIVQFTLFNNLSEPKAERLIFIDRHDQLRLNVGTPKVSSTNSVIQIPIEATDQLANPVSANFSVAVVNRKAPVDSTTSTPSILSDLLLTSDLSGYIEYPDHYFKSREPQISLQLDNLMLTQGWRRFIWKDLLAGKFPDVIYPAQTQQTLSGKIQTGKGSALSKQNVMLVSKGDSAFTIRTVTDSKGRFTFNLPELQEQHQFSVIASTDSKDINIILDQFAPADSTSHVIKEELSNYPAQSPTNQAHTIKNGTRQLSEVVVKSKKLSATEKAVAPSANFNGAGNANQIITYKDLNHCDNLEICLEGRLVGVYFRIKKDPFSHGYTKVPYSTSGLNKPMLFVLDGVPIQPGQISLNSIPARDVQSIEVLRSGSLIAAYGLAGSGGVLVITTKKGGINYNEMDEPEDITVTSTPGVINFTYNGYQKYREFYVPKYPVADRTKRNSPETLFWNPVVKTNDKGQSVLEFPVSAEVKNIALTIEGISDDGKIGYQYQEYAIK
ncbi:TonB-dependent receptor plug domain-containing protein [Mucilaginibacter endophyticus]|uniref:TonB-dependent receptor plug domain-containing protein n=1 Tax=Mucilaginibacter endophyticus TaxID=2675003 RepID=UPI000E0D0E70|nr:TonB-dependent receptor plug domain-containing protein [Mucilaginibacter endophyticus]